jgi:putative iron-dependent peroxidase
MGNFQTGLVAEANSNALFITLNQTHQPNALQTIKATLKRCVELQDQLNQQYPEADLYLVAAIGSSYWDLLSPSTQPAQLCPFPAMENAGSVAPSTPADLLFHIRSERQDLNFELAQKLMGMLGGAVQLVEEVNCFRYLDSRDMTGFVDGTENPQGIDRIEVALVGEEDTDFSGGSYIHLQRYVHDLAYWNNQPLKTQEDALGRTKADNVEYASADKPLGAHTRRTSLKDDEGRSIEILRHSMPYGDTKECGLLFASYCRTPENFTVMLKSMIEGDGEGHTDHLLKYTRAVTGQAFFAPSISFLSSL